MADRKKKQGPPPVISDPRFAKLHTDPRFQRIPRAKTKVAIDPRFEGMFKDPAFQSKFVVDKRGRKKGSRQGENLEKYYRLEKEVGGSKAEESVEQERKNGEDKKTSKKENREVVRPKRKVDLKKEEKATEESLEKQVDNGADSEEASESDSETAERDVLREGFGSEESSSSSDEEESEVEDEAEDKWEEPEKVLTSNEETRRLALVNLDWEYIRAVDILMMLRSFLPERGSIESVTVYPSDFGLERMKEEEVKGPQPLWRKLEEGEDEESDGEGAGVNMEKLREYEKSKLRYYYAVVSCDSPATAAVLYSSCDGLEFEKSSNKLDLRFIPDEMSFEGRPIRDESTAVPADYVAPDFETRALQHSNVKLTWDEDEPARQKTLRRKFGNEEIDNLDLNAYIADTDTDEEGSDSDADDTEILRAEVRSVQDPLEDRKAKRKEKREKERERLRKLLLGGDEHQGKEGGESDDEEDQEMEITFNTGLNDLSEKLEQKKKEKEMQAKETTWEAYLRKKRERKKARKKGTQTDGADESDGSMDDGDAFFQHDKNPFNDPFFADGTETKAANEKAARGRSNKKTERELEREKKRAEAEVAKRDEARQKADLELLMMDDDLVMVGRLQNGSDRPAGFNLKAARRKEKEKLKKRKGQRIDEDAIEDEQAASRVKVDFEDPRFGALFTSHHFAIDPTDPRFSKTSGQLEVLAEKQRRRARDLQKAHQNGQSAEVAEAAREPPVHSIQPRAELSSLVKSLKRKVEAKTSKESRNKEAKREKQSF